MPRNKRHHDDEAHDRIHMPGTDADHHVTMTTKPADSIVNTSDAAIVKQRNG